MLESGDKIGDYTLARFLGRGQFGEVWLAEKEIRFSTRKFQHALKFLFKREEEINLKAVEAEIDTWIEASGHPNVMSVLDMIVYKDYIIIASEYAEGGSLKKWLTKYKGKAPSHEKALKMMTGILSGIEHLHSRNVVHRDLKPDNILLQGNFPRITDFGISRIVSAGSLSTVAMGSPFYMSPESFDGSKSTQTDIWSAGVILYEMLTGGHPYHSDTIYGLVNSIRYDAPKPLPDDIPLTIRQIVETALEKDLARRFHTAQAMRMAIEQEAHELKVRLSNQINFLKGKKDVPSSTDFSLVTFKEMTVEEDDILISGKKARETHKTNVENTLGSQPEEMTPDNPVTVADSVQAPPLGWSQNTVTANVEKLREPLDPDSGVNTEIGQAEASPVSFAVSGFGNSQPTPPTRRWLVVAAILSVLAIGLGVGLVRLISVGTALDSNGTVANTPPPSAEATSTDAASGSAASKEIKPTPPPGMVYVQGGTFVMGRDSGDVKEEKPAHDVTVESFYMDKYEVTNGEYADFVNQTNHKPPRTWRKKTFKSGEERFPVVGVNWDDARAYAEWKGKRLPTEQEWEFAARGTDKRLYPWGNEWHSGYANIDGAKQTLAEVGEFKGASPYDIYDMVGNAGEWTSSDFKSYPGGQSVSSYRRGENLKVRRGADYDTPRKYATATFRLGLKATGDNYDLTGFRCAQDIRK